MQFGAKPGKAARPLSVRRQIGDCFDDYRASVRNICQSNAVGGLFDSVYGVIAFDQYVLLFFHS